MPSRSRFLVPLAIVVGAGASLSVAPVAVADPVAGNQSAAATIDELKAEGYDVAINWVGGRSSMPLSRCSVTAIHNPVSSPPPPGTFTTVYVDVSCPNDSDDSGFYLGPFGFGYG